MLRTPSRARVLRLALLGILASAGTVASVATAGGGKETPARLTPKEEARVELGRRLFFDPRVSRAGMRSCADCHDPEHGYSDKARVSRDDRGPTRRHSQTLLDGADNPTAHWDGAFSRVEDLVTARVMLSQRGRISNGHEFISAGGRLAGSSISDFDKSGGARVDPPQVEAPKVPEPAMDDGGMDGGGMDGGGYDGSAPRAPSSEAPPEERPTTPSEPASTPGATPTPSPSAPAAGATPPKSPDAGNGGAGGPAAGSAKDADKRLAEDPFATPADESNEDLPFLDPTLETGDLPLADQAIAAAGRYREAFAAAYGTPQVTIKKIAEAIEAYCHSIRSGEAAYDRFVAGDKAALSASAQRGLALFEGRAGCASCHTTGGKRAAFTDYAFHDTGVTWRSIHVDNDTNRLAIADKESDLGAANVTGRPKMRRAFKTPTLRDVARRGPYMHDGSLATLDAVVRHYEAGTTDPQADAKLPAFTATAAERADLVAFLRSLSSAERPGLATAAWKDRTDTIRLRLVDAAGKPLALTRVKAVPAGDRLPGADPRADDGSVEMTDEAGWLSIETPQWTHVRLVPGDGIEPIGGALVPDTCREAVVVVPVAGRVRLLLTMPKGVEAPAAVVADHVDAKVFPDRRRPRTVLRRESAIAVGDKEIALYTAVFRTDVPPRVSLRLPVKSWGMDRLRVTLDPKDDVRIDLSK